MNRYSTMRVWPLTFVLWWCILHLTLEYSIPVFGHCPLFNPRTMSCTRHQLQSHRLLYDTRILLLNCPREKMSAPNAASTMILLLLYYHPSVLSPLPSEFPYTSAMNSQTLKTFLVHPGYRSSTSIRYTYSAPE